MASVNNFAMFILDLKKKKIPDKFEIPSVFP